MSKIFFQSYLYTENKDLLLSTILFLKRSLAFQEALNNYWKLHEKDYDGRISSYSLQEHLVLIYKFLFPYFNKKTIEDLVNEEMAQILSIDSPKHILLDQFYEFFAKFCVIWIETPSLQAALNFLEMILQRTTKLVYRNINSKEMKFADIDYHIEVMFYEKEKSEKLVNIQEKKKRDDIIYYQEKLVLNEYLKQQAEIEFDIVSERILMRWDEIIPLGFSLESVLLQLMNQDYNIELVRKQNQTILISEHFTTKACQKLSGIKLYAHMTESTLAYLKKFLEFHIYFSSAVLEETNSGKPEDECYIYRLNQVLIRKYIFKKLKNKHSINPQFYNILSAFHDFDDYEIDLIDKLHKEWNERADDHEEMTPFPRFDSLDPEDSQLSAFNLMYLAIKEKLSCMSKTHAEEFVDSKILKEKENILPSLNFHNYISKNDCLPFDNADPYIEDIIEYSNQAPLQILVLSKPKVGKSAFCSSLAKKMDIFHIDPEISLQKLFKKIKDFEENPELDEENNPKEFLSPLEKEIMNDLKSGKEIPNDSLLELINLELDDPLVSLKGFILDIPLIDFAEFSWLSQIFNGSMRLPQILCRYFTHIINLDITDSEVINFTGNLKENLEDLKLYSEYDRILLKNPKPKLEEEAEAEKELEEKKPLNDENLLKRPGDCLEFIEPLLEKYQQKTSKKIQNLTSHLTKSQYITIQAAGLPVDQLSDIALANLSLYRDPLRPLPIRLDPGSDGNLKELLTQGLDEGKPARKWSAFYQIDPVELFQGKVIAGKAEFPVTFAGKVFLFDKEENLLEFVKNPCKFLKNRPKMPKGYNISICGPHLSGKKTYADQLHRIYGWKVLDVEKIVAESILDQKSWPAHIASNPANNKIHCSEPEWKDIVKGGALSARNVLPIVLHSLGIPLQKRPPKPPPKEGEEGYEEYKALEEAKENNLKEEEKNKEKPGSKKGPRVPAKKKEEKIEEKEDEEKEPPLEDLSLKDLSLLTDEYGQSQPISGYIFINFPVNEEQVQAMKEMNFSIDKVIFLVDTNEEETEPGKILSSRPNFEEEHSLENELAFSDAALKTLQEQLTEEIVKTVSIVGPISEVFNRIRTIVDPFYVRVDEEGTVRVPGDLVEGDEPLPYSDYGPYCPITLLEEGWLVPGKEDQELQVKSKRYRFYSEKELKIFRNYVEKYAGNISKTIPPPPPRLMFFGVRGSGLRTQLRLLNEKYKISTFDLKEEMLSQLSENKTFRKRMRVLMRSFKPKELNEEGQEIEDPEIQEESADFDKKQHEISVLSSLISPLKEIFINGNFFDIDEEIISTPLLEMLQEAKRLPEVAVFLKVSDKQFLSRVFDETKIRTEYNNLLNDLKKKRAEEKRIARQQAIDNGEEPPEEEPEGPIEEDPDAPKLEDMLQEQRDKLLQRREADLSKIEELIEGFGSAGIPAIVLDSDRDIQSVFKAILWELKPFLESRENKLEKHQVIMIPEEKVHHYKSSYHIKKSRFHDFNALDLSHLPINHDNCFLYRDRLFFFEDEEKRKMVSLEPLKYLKNPEIPLDINYKPAIFLIGRPKSGVSSLAKIIEKNLGLVRVKISKILEELKENNSSKLGYEALQLMRLGSSPSEEMYVELIAQRVQQKDCIERGWILDSFPQTIWQARLLAQKGIIPNCVLSMQLNDLDVKKRVQETTKILRLQFESMKVEFLKKKQEEAEENEELKKNRNSIAEYEFEYQKLKMGYDAYLLHQRLRKTAIEITNLENFYLVHYNNVKFLNGNLSKWGLYERAKLYIQKTIKQRQMLARALVLREPCIIGDLTLGQKVILEFLSEFKNYCPVSFKSKQEFAPLSLRNRFLTFFNFKIYNLLSHKHFEDFKKQPHNYLDKNLVKLFQLLPNLVCFEQLLVKGMKPNQEGYDVIELSNKILKKGKKHYQIEYKKMLYLFKNCKNMKIFMRNPEIYADLKLPTKYIDEKAENSSNNARKKDIKDSSSSYLENNLAQIMMKVLAQLGYNKLKYPTISSQETALKFVALSLKANNPNQNEYYRRKYQKKLQDFVNACKMSENFYQEHERRIEAKKTSGEWNDWDEENYLKLAEELEIYLRNISSKDKTSYFYEYIR